MRSSIVAFLTDFGTEDGYAGAMKGRLLSLAPHVNVIDISHAAGLFKPDGELILLREDIGRHNALDKLIGAALYKGLLPLENYIILVSGRVGYELVEKAIVAGAGVLAAIGAPSSIAVQTAETFGLTLIGFLRSGSFNCYSGTGRISA